MVLQPNMVVFFYPWYVIAYIHLILFQPSTISPHIILLMFAVFYCLLLPPTGSSWPKAVFSHSLQKMYKEPVIHFPKYIKVFYEMWHKLYPNYPHTVTSLPSSSLSLIYILATLLYSCCRWVALWLSNSGIPLCSVLLPCLSFSISDSCTFSPVQCFKQ